MAVSSRNGWGFQNALIAATKVVAGANQVATNVGAAIQVVAGGPLRLTKLAYRVDIAPDVAPGAAVGPVRWRLVVVDGILPPDISAYQVQAFANGSHPEIPSNVAFAAPQTVLFDTWLDFSAGDPGLSRLAYVDFADAGPAVGGSETITVLLCAIIDANIDQSVVAASNAMLTLGAWGTGQTVNPQGGSSNTAGDSQKSIPRYDVSFGEAN